jgi:DNA-binding NarL/FixJ family response regulator
VPTEDGPDERFRPVGGSALLPAGQRVRVLLVDDDPSARWASRWLLTAAGLLVVGEAGDAHEALVMVGRVAPTVAVVDLRVRRSGVFGLLTLLHRLGQAASAVTVVVHTAAVELQVHRAAYGAGAFVVVRKGGPGERLVAAVRAAHVAGARRGRGRA